jgi:Tat protein secretion system quality control protein TatD with DNase activity
VRAYGALLDILTAVNVDVPVVLHAWTGSVDMTSSLLKLPNVYISINGYITKLKPEKVIPMV